MKTNDYNKIYTKYLEGESSSEEENFLKESAENQEDKAWFDVLKEEKQIQMDWSFEEMLEKAENREKIVQLKPWYLRKSIYGAADSIALLISFLLYQNTQQVDTITTTTVDPKTTNNISQSNVNQNVTTVQVATKDDVNNVPKNDVPKVAHLPKKRVVKSKPKDEKIVTTLIDTVMAPIAQVVVDTLQYKPSYLVVNGVEIKDEEKAIELTLNSLGLVRRQFQEMASVMDDLKKMQIKL